jgi:hypothetical protein
MTEQANEIIRFSVNNKMTGFESLKFFRWHSTSVIIQKIRVHFPAVSIGVNQENSFE